MTLLALVSKIIREWYAEGQMNTYVTVIYVPSDSVKEEQKEVFQERQEINDQISAVMSWNDLNDIESENITKTKQHTRTTSVKFRYG